MDLYKEPFERLPATELISTLESSTEKSHIRLFIAGVNLEGNDVQRGLLLPLGQGSTAKERLQKSGLTLLSFNNEVQVAQVKFGSVAAKLGFEQGFKVVGLEVPVDRPPKEWVYIFALMLLGLVITSQKLQRRST
jgi:hypothetical protein